MAKQKLLVLTESEREEYEDYLILMRRSNIEPRDEQKWVKLSRQAQTRNRLPEEARD